MSKLLIAMIAAAFANVVIAQGASPPADVKAPTTQTTEVAKKEAKAAKSKAKHEQLESATKDIGHARRAGEAAAKAEGTGASASPQRRAASAGNVASKTEDIGYTRRAAEESAKAKGDKTPKPYVPKPQAGTPEANKLVP